MQEADIAVDYFESGYSCSQGILTAFGEMFGLDNDIAIKVAGAFGAGMSYLGQTCGAVSGALMVIGLKYGATGEDKAAHVRDCLRLCQTIHSTQRHYFM
jgi:C_GCAxxG_C_C family probable redox protein